MKKIGSEITRSENYLKREDSYKNFMRKLKAVRETIEMGGGTKAIEKQHQRGKMTARERIAKLIDENSRFIELNTFAAHDMYLEYGGAPSSGTIYGIGKIHGRNFVIVANDATVKAGAWFPITAKKNLRAQEIVIIIYLEVVAYRIYNGSPLKVTR